MSTNTLGLKEFSCQDAYVQIKKYLGDGNIPTEFENSLTNLRIAGDEFVVNMGTMDAPADADVLKQVIGRGGCYFIRTTQECDLDFIWHNRETAKIEFWGPRKNIPFALDVIKDRVRKVKERQQAVENQNNGDTQ